MFFLEEKEEKKFQKHIPKNMLQSSNLGFFHICFRQARG